LPLDAICAYVDKEMHFIASLKYFRNNQYDTVPLPPSSNVLHHTKVEPMGDGKLISNSVDPFVKEMTPVSVFNNNDNYMTAMDSV